MAWFIILIYSIIWNMNNNIVDSILIYIDSLVNAFSQRNKYYGFIKNFRLAQSMNCNTMVFWQRFTTIQILWQGQNRLSGFWLSFSFKSFRVICKWEIHLFFIIHLPQIITISSVNAVLKPVVLYLQSPPFHQVDHTQD